MVGAFSTAVYAIVTDQIQITAGGDLSIIDHPQGGLEWWGVLQNVFFIALLVTLVLSVTRQVVAFRRSTGERRLQLQWLMGGVVVFAVFAPLNLLTSDPHGWMRLVTLVAEIALAVLPLCMGVAILKYRLFDIDRIISRTLSYAVVTATLVGGYIGVVAFTTRVLPFSSPVGVAASTLAAAALFNPVRRTVQRVVDQRFNRRRYDAVRTVAAFADRLRATVSLNDVRDDLITVVETTLSPASASLWLPQLLPAAEGQMRLVGRALPFVGDGDGLTGPMGQGELL